MQDPRTIIVTRRFRIAGLGDAEGAARVQQVLLSVPGVHGASVDVERQSLVVRMADYVTDPAVAEAVEAAGYTLLTAETGQQEEPSWPPADHGPPARAPAEVSSPRTGWNRGSIWKNTWFYGSRLAAGVVALSILLTIVYRFLPVPTTMLMLGEGAFGAHAIRRNWVPLEDISPNLIRSVIASEDAAFCSHAGFDFRSMEAAWKDAERGRRLRGASTISQQTAKNVFLWEGRTWVRKGLEVYFTALIELLWSKERIMEVYLNVIEMGDGIYGAQAASQAYFKKDAKKLSTSEAALIAAILPSPLKYSARRPGSYVQKRQGWISRQMGHWGGKLDYDAPPRHK